MAVPKRRSSKGRVRRKRNAHYKRKEVQVVSVKNKKGYKRPHVEESIEL
ncbi:MAG TPA: 50S ribosomal protein L32 [bacterium]|jgi:ribosomal protein L32|nr:50S ribosomal protein L32 [bacterium]HOV97690.1 50S ribosomal protein L32 [bacterium]HQG58405.1 50S ribosomal protein L32 [bacterium]HQG78968.1 50S ribosomal protein L32 [bacterium]HQK41650.1 50S ribosomal protein L32 [bacterium]